MVDQMHRRCLPVTFKYFEDLGIVNNLDYCFIKIRDEIQEIFQIIGARRNLYVQAKLGNCQQQTLQNKQDTIKLDNFGQVKSFRGDKSSTGVPHLDDYQFERVWKSPLKLFGYA